MIKYFLLSSFVAFFSFFTSLFSPSGNYTTGPIEEREAFQMIDDFATQYGKDHNSMLIVVGDFLNTHRTVFGVWIANFSLETLESGRNVAVDFLDAFWAHVQKSPKGKTYFEFQCKESFTWYTPPLSLKYVTLRIAFWDKEVDRPKIPYLAEITFFDNKFHYYQADPETEALQLILEETYEEAKEKVKSAQGLVK